MNLNKTDDILKAILMELKAIELQVVISRYENDVRFTLEKSENLSPEVRNELVNQLTFIKESDTQMFNKRYSVWKAHQRIKEREAKENDDVTDGSDDITNGNS